MSNLFSRIAIGTANFGKEYNGHKVSKKDVDKILGYAQSSGIDTLDCATAYGWDWTQVNSYFNIILKIRAGEQKQYEDDDRVELMAHSWEDYEKIDDVYLNSVSLYEPEWGLESHDIGINLAVAQIPYSLYDRRFEHWMERAFCDEYTKTEIHVRSIFLRGKIIEDGIPAEECLKFVLCNPYVDKVILGVDSIEQLQRNLDFIHRWSNMKKSDEQLLDPRKWT